MPEPSAQAINTITHNRYVEQDRSVNIKQALDKQAKTKQANLDGITVRETAQQLGKDDFLKLLVTQLTYQDPTAPVKDQQFIAQMAQFSSLEQMQNISKSLSRLAEQQAHQIIGRYVAGRDFVSGQTISGQAQALFYDQSGKPFIKVGGRAISLNEIQMIGDPSLLKTQEARNQKKAEKEIRSIEMREEIKQKPEQKQEAKSHKQEKGNTSL